MGETYTFIGDSARFYMTYVDVEADRPLTAVPGRRYAMRPTAPQWPVPPSDGRWGPPDDAPDAVDTDADQPVDSGEPATSGTNPPTKPTARAARAAKGGER